MIVAALTAAAFSLAPAPPVRAPMAAAPPPYQRPIHNPPNHWPFFLTFTPAGGARTMLMSYPTMDLCKARLAMIVARRPGDAVTHKCEWLTPALGK